MSKKLKGFAKDSLLYGLGDFVGKLTGLILVPILSRVFVPAEYGVIDLLNITYVFVSINLGLNVVSGFQKFFYLTSGEERRVLSTSIISLLFLLSTAFAILVIIFSQNISYWVFSKPDYYIIIILAAIRLPLESAVGGLLLLLRLNRKAIAFSFYNVMQVIILPTTTYICVVTFDLGLNGVFLSPLIMYSILGCCSFIHQKAEFTTRIDFSKAAEVTRFSLPGQPAGIVLNIINILPRYLLTYYAGLSAVGLFGMADRIAKVVDMTKTAFNRAWNPFAFSNAGKEDEKYLYEKVFKLFAAMLIFLSLTLTLFSREVLFVLTPPQYHSAAFMVGGLCLYFTIKALTLIFSTGLYSVNRVGSTSILGIIELFVFILSAVTLMPYYKASGLVLALNIGAVVYFICYAVAVKKYFRFNFSCSEILPVLGVALTVYLLFEVSITGHAVNAKLIVSKISFLFLHGIISYFVILNKHERRLIHTKIRYFTALRFSQ